MNKIEFSLTFPKTKDISYLIKVCEPKREKRAKSRSYLSVIDEAMLMSNLVGGPWPTGDMNRELVVVKRYTIVQHCQEKHAEGEHSALRALHVPTSVMLLHPCPPMGAC